MGASTFEMISSMNLDSREEIQSVKSVFSIFHSFPLKGNNKACKTNTHVIFIPWKNNNINDDDNNSNNNNNNKNNNGNNINNEYK